MFTDTAQITLTAGRGGDGTVAWRREKYIPKGGPAGGNGGNGGSIILQTDPQTHSLESFRNQRHIKAKNGMPGGGSNKQGHGGPDLVIKIPCGTLIKDPDTKEILYDLKDPGMTLTLCKGGIGGKGNTTFKSPTNQAPNTATPGTEGESKELELELKLIADVGFVGMPNAGKSTLMQRITHTPVKIAPYPFTTLTPNLSFIEFEDYSRILIADIPGIIEKAHANKGLGLAFLRHIERTSTLVFVIDAAGTDNGDPIRDFKILQNELRAYGKKMLEKPFLIALNKADTEDAKVWIEEFKKTYPFDSATLFEISALTGKGMAPFLTALQKLVQRNGKRF